MLEKILFKKIPLWAVISFMIIWFVITIFFGASVKYFYTSKTSKFSNLEPVVKYFAELPYGIYSLWVTGISQNLAVIQRYNSDFGYNFHYVKGENPSLGYILLNRWDPLIGDNVSELIDLNNQKIVHTWKGVLKHALLDVDGKIYTKQYVNGSKNLVSLDYCSNAKNVVSLPSAHHSIESIDENLWIGTSQSFKDPILGTNNFKNDSISLVSKNSGEIIFEKSIMDIFESNNLGAMLYGEIKREDPFHLNDIQPVLDDGKYWKKGDVFLSLRDQSMIMLYRPSSNKVIWYQQGPWLKQHDVDIINDHQIQIFNNNVSIGETKYRGVKQNNNIYLYDFETEKLSKPFEEAFIKYEIRTPSEGLADITENGSLFIEETDYGRVYLFDKNMNILFDYTNTHEGKVYVLEWSRFISKSTGELVSKEVRNLKCYEK